MKRIWAPWRIQYIKGPKDKGCFFCDYPKESDDQKHLIVHRGKKSFVLMNYYPYNNGHLLIAPYKHAGEFDQLDDDTKLEMFNYINSCIKALKEKFNAEGFNVGINIGQVAGAGIKDHIHIHVVPRWNGDTNFMPVAGHAKVISQGLEDAWKSLKQYFDNSDDY